ncbi:MAG TPA: NUDIX domain-containing protein [Acidimicrobiales bacterium]|nr:NUDIX domain-containing protein [Acidimicrobiales bacterium]
MTAVPGAPTVAVGGVAVVDGSLLMVRRANPPEAGRWTIPGGRVEAGETIAEAVERELGEETGLDVRCGQLRGWVERILPGYHFVILDFDVTVEGTRDLVAGGDALEVGWVPLEQVESFETVSGLVEFLRGHGVVG